VSLLALLAGAPFAAAQQSLYSNGPFITHPGQGPGGADVSVLQTILGATSYGFSCRQFADNFRLADDFTVPAGGWTLASIVFYEFQPNAPVGTPTIRGTNLRIWRGRPGDPGSTVIFGDATNNRVLSVAAAHAFRTPDTDLTDTRREIYKVEVAVSPPLALAPGAYWLDWQSDGSLNGGPFSVPVTVLGSTGAPGGNARFYNGSSWSNLREGSTNTAQELTFILRGTTGAGGACYANCDGGTAAPFLNVNDYICFQGHFAAGDPYANCDGSTLAPVLNVNDFVCFQGRFAAGCSAP
jgi:hypothetical protein